MLNYTLYKLSDDAEWVTFIHGAGGSSKVWYRQIKAFKEKFNVLLLDLRGHGKSKSMLSKVKSYSFQFVSQDVIDVLDYLKVEKSHFLGFSLGTIIVHEIAELRPKMVQSMILSGAILKLNFSSQILMKVGTALRKVLPYMILYKIFAFIILPRKEHKASRNIFIKEAKKLYKKEFLRWYKLTNEVNTVLKIFRQRKSSIRSLYIMGSEDYMFLPAVQLFVSKNENAKLKIVPNCGHIVNVQSPNLFNQTVFNFLNK